jgi:iron complex transport system substrate-binding protein
METDASLSRGFEDAPDLTGAPQRVVSLVPSITESLFDLGVGDAVVGVSDYCSQPFERVRNLPRVGGINDPRVEDILALRPQLVIAGREENPRQAVEALRARCVPVWVVSPRSVQQTVAMLWELVGIFQSAAARLRLQTLEVTLEWAQHAMADQPRVRYFCPIWREDHPTAGVWWMTFNSETYAHDLLSLLGGENIFAGRRRRYPLEADLGLAVEEEAPGGRDVRYPRVSLAEAAAAAPDCILLPSEPFRFEGRYIEELAGLLADTPAVREGRLVTVDGSLVTWYGTRTVKAVTELANLFVSGGM